MRAPRTYWRPRRAGAQGALGHLSPPHCFSDKNAREAAFNLVQQFTQFAEKTCGCTATSNRAHVRRAVFHATLDIDLAPFVSSRLGGDVSAIESISRMECPVMVPDKTMLKVKLPESAPKRIVYAAKTLRKHFSLTETQTCRSCNKRSRCRFFRAPAEESNTPGVWHVSRVLFGMAQYARGHLQHPDAYPFYFTPENLASANTLLGAIAEHLEEERTGPLYQEIPSADEETVREIYLAEARRKLERKQAAMEERLLSLPQWMQETLRPVPTPDMTRQQRELLEKHAKSGGTAAESAISSIAGEKEEWVEEGAVPGELADPLVYERIPKQESASVNATSSAKASLVEDLPITNLDNSQTIATTKRFEHVAPTNRSKVPAIQQFNSVLGGTTTGVYAVEGERWAHRIDLDVAAGKQIDLEADLEELSETRGGYTIVDLLSTATFENVPKGALQFVSLSPRALEGVHQYGSAPSPKRLHPRVLENLWNRDAGGKNTDELPFIARVPFDSGIGRSGGALPPGKLPREKLLVEKQRELPPPVRQRKNFNAHQGSAENGDALEQTTRRELQVVELDSPGDILKTEDLDTLKSDEDLVSRALRDDHGQIQNRHARFEERLPGEASSSETADTEDQRFTAWTSRPRLPLVSVLEPRVDFRRLDNPNHLDNMNVEPDETDVIARQKAPLPHDEAFVSTFRRPLTAVSGDDPLGVAAPGIDIDVIKVEATNQPSPSHGLEQDSGFIFGGELKFPKLRKARHAFASSVGSEDMVKNVSGSAKIDSGNSINTGQQMLGSSGQQHRATTQLPPRLGRLRQSRLEDLSDLVRPGLPDARSPVIGALGQIPHPQASQEDLATEFRQPLSSDAQREQQNAAVAMQRLLNKQIKESMRQQFPSSSSRSTPQIGAQGSKTHGSSQVGRRPTRKLFDLVRDPWRQA